jgi:hypothetical protein
MSMSKLRGCAYAAIAAFALASPLTSPANANQGNGAAAYSYQPAVHTARPMPAPPKAVAVPQTTLSWPEGSPDYHGANGG